MKPAKLQLLAKKRKYGVLWYCLSLNLLKVYSYGLGLPKYKTYPSASSISKPLR